MSGSNNLTAMAYGVGYSAMLGVGVVSSSIFKPISIIDPNNTGGFGLSLSPLALTTSGAMGFNMSFGAGLTASYSTENFSVGIGMNFNQNGFNNLSIGGEVRNGKNAYSYYHTWYSQGDKQRTGTLGFRNGNSFSLQWENDVFARSGDKYRSNAVELGFNKFVIGTNVYTDARLKPKGDEGINSSNIYGKQLLRYLIGGEVSSYDGANRRSSPFYVGYRKGNGIVRAGIDTNLVGDIIQNGFHWAIANSPYFGQGNYSTQPYLQIGSYSPYSLYW